MKRLISFLLALIIVFSLTGCYNDNEKDEQQTKSSTSKHTEIYETEEDDTNDIYTNTYILNKSTYKFHYPDCGSVKLMSKSNKKVYKGTRAEVISMGYVACQRCYP